MNVVKRKLSQANIPPAGFLADSSCGVFMLLTLPSELAGAEELLCRIVGRGVDKTGLKRFLISPKGAIHKQVEYYAFLSFDFIFWFRF